MKIYLACDTFKESWLAHFLRFFPKTVARDQGHSDPENVYDTMLPQIVSTNQILDSYVNWAASKQNLSSGFPTKRYSNQPAKPQRPARKLKFRFSKSRYDIFLKVNNKGADQTAHMRRLVCAFVPRKPPKTGFLASRPIIYRIYASTSDRLHVRSLKGLCNYFVSSNGHQRKRLVKA